MYFDRPFDIGDFIVVDTFRGTVKRIGIRTTRLNSVDGEEIILANGDLARARVRNYARLTERRGLFLFGIEYGADAERIERVVTLCREIFGGREGVRLERAHFKGFGPSSLDFEVVFHVQSPDMAIFMEQQQFMYLALLRALAAEGLSFAFPTQTLHLKKS